MVGHAYSDGSIAREACQLGGSGGMLPQRVFESEVVSGAFLVAKCYFCFP